MSIQQVAMKAAKQSEFFLKKNAPTILTGVGVAGFVATTAFTIRATAKAEELNQKDASQVLAKAYTENVIEIAKIYAPTFAIGSASIICVLSAHDMMLKRQAGLVAVYTAIDASFKAYRHRVVEKIGDAEELELSRRVCRRFRVIRAVNAGSPESTE